MKTPTLITLVDRDKDRTAELIRLLAAHGVNCLHHEFVADLAASRELGEAILVANDSYLVDEVLAVVGRQAIKPAVIIHSQNPSIEDVVTAMRKGASDYLAWPIDEGRLLAAIAGRARDSEAADQRQSSRQISGQSALYSGRIERLTRRERQVLSAVAMGRSNREIADVLGISHRTVEIHRANMLTKLQATNSADAVRMAVESGMVS